MHFNQNKLNNVAPEGSMMAKLMYSAVFISMQSHIYKYMHYIQKKKHTC